MLLDVVFPVLLIAVLAFFAQPRLRLDVQSLARVTFYFFTPALVLNSLANSSLSSDDFGRIAAAAILIVLLLWLISLPLVRALRLDGTAESGFLLATLFVNAGNYGLPVSLFAFGESGLAIATVYYATTSMIQSSLGVYLAARGDASAGQALRAVLRVPQVYAALLGLVLNLTDLSLPTGLARCIDLLAQAAIPVMLVVLGVQLSNLIAGSTRRFRSVGRAVAFATLTRLLLGPLLGLVVALFLGLHELTRNVVIVQSAMPTAVATIILATEYRAEPEFVTTTVFLSTLASIVTITGILNVLT
jgi:predicted permease